MPESTKSVQSLEELRRYIADTLSSFESLKSDQLQLSQQILYRGERPCGIHFCLHGPRMLRLSAIWDLNQNCVLFYGSCGRRMHRTKLTQSSSVEAYHG
jgi:hypothetical protein